MVIIQFYGGRRLQKCLKTYREEAFDLSHRFRI